jgi:hypothetical protein
MYFFFAVPVLVPDMECIGNGFGQRGNLSQSCSLLWPACLVFVKAFGFSSPYSCLCMGSGKVGFIFYSCCMLQICLHVPVKVAPQLQLMFSVLDLLATVLLRRHQLYLPFPCQPSYSISALLPKAA